MASNVINLNYINQSNENDDAEIVIFQKNVATSFEELAVAWKVIQYCGQNCRHPFTYTYDFTIDANDSYGNYIPQDPMDAENGAAYQVYDDGTGNVLKYYQVASSSTEVETWNNLSQGAITANIYRDDKLLATKTGIAPGQKAVFEFNPTIWIGVASQITEGEVMDSAVISQFNTEISLKGIASADIVLTGGGSDANATPFEFTLQNIVYT